MLTQLQQTADGIHLFLAGAGSMLSIVQPAVTPIAPISPKTSINTLLGAVLGFLVLSGLVLLIDAADTRPRTPSEVSGALGLPLLGTVSAGASILADPMSEQADAFRMIRANLGASGGSGRVVSISGAGSTDAAPAVAANLAALMARSGQRVILVDANLRHPTLRPLFALPERGGLAALLHDGEAPAPDAVDGLVQDVGIPGLGVLAAGHNAAECIDLLASARTGALFSALRRAADVVLVLAAGAGSPEAMSVAAASDATILVAGLNGSARARLQEAADTLRQVSPELAGVVVALGPETGPKAATRGADVPETVPASQASTRNAR